MNLFNLESSLDKSGKKYDCPNCRRKTLSKYVYNCSNKYVGDKFGKCNRGDYCGYHLIPSYNFYSQYNEIVNKEQYGITGSEDYSSLDDLYFGKPQKFTHSIPIDYLTNSKCDSDNSNLAKFITFHLKDEAYYLLNKYHLGLSELEDSACNIFWKIDNNFIIRSGIATLYNKDDGRREKVYYLKDLHQSNITFTNFFNCFFGAHLINVCPRKDIAIVQDEKVAIVCSYFWPEFNWLATGIIENIQWREYEVYNVLVNKKVILFSDYDLPVLPESTMKLVDWKEMAEYYEINIPCSVTVNSLIKDKFNTLDKESHKLLYSLLKPNKYKNEDEFNMWGGS